MMSVYEFLFEYLGNGGLYSEPPSPLNKHQIKDKMTPAVGNHSPYQSSDADVENADIAIEELEEIFTHTQPAGPSMGSIIGKAPENVSHFDDYDPSDFDERDLDSLKGRMDSKAKSSGALIPDIVIGEERGARQKTPRADITTKNGWQNGLPVSDKKDLTVGDFIIDLLDDDDT